MKVQIKVENFIINVMVSKDTNFRILKEILRDTLSPKLSNPNINWGGVVERIRDTVLPLL